MKRTLKIVFLLAAILLIVLITFFATLFLGGFGEIPSEKKLELIRNEEASQVYSEEGILLGKFFTTNRVNITYEEFPDHLINALIATEDARFYEHKGVDGRSLIRVLLKTILMGDASAGGGSTLSQQLAKNLYGRKDYGKITILVNKLKEIILANRLEKLYTKEQILELYLNTVPFGENIYGIEMASRRFYSKPAKDLKVEEAAVLVGLLKANSYYNPRSQADHALLRRNTVIDQLLHYDYISPQEGDSLKQLPLSLKYTNTLIHPNRPYLLNAISKEVEKILESISTDSVYNYLKDGLKIYTSIDASLQNSLSESTARHLSMMQLKLDQQYKSSYWNTKLNALALKVAKQSKIKELNKKENRTLFYWGSPRQVSISALDSIKHYLKQIQATSLAISPKSGAIKAYLGGINYQYYPYDQVNAKRQLASTFKPFLYATALLNGYSPCDYLSNKEIVLEDYEGWSPSNYDGTSGGYYSMAAALALSKNLPTLDLYLQTNWDSLNLLWNKMGFIDELNQEPSVILGTNSASLTELVVAYASFANFGFLVEPYLVDSIADSNGKLIYQHKAPKPSRILDEKVCSMINEMLAKTVNSGTANKLRSSYGVKAPLAAKTGTSQNYADARMVIYNNDLVLSTRVGNALPSVHFANGTNGSSTALALPIIGLTLQAEQNEKWLGAGLRQSNSVNCEDFKEDSVFDKIFNIFSPKETSLEKARTKTKKKKKTKRFFDKLFGK